MPCDAHQFKFIMLCGLYAVVGEGLKLVWFLFRCSFNSSHNDWLYERMTQALFHAIVFFKFFSFMITGKI